MQESSSRKRYVMMPNACGTPQEDSQSVITLKPLGRWGFTVVLLSILTVPTLGSIRQADKPAQQPPAAETPAQTKPGDAKTAEPKVAQTQAELDAALAERLRQISAKKPADWTAEELAERVAIAYRGFNFAQLRKVYNTGREEGRISIVTANGDLAGEYTRRYVFGPKITQDRVRLDIIFETSPKPQNQLRYTLTYNGAAVWAAQDNRYTQPDPAAAAAFKASVISDYTALFRWAEDGATLVRLPAVKIQGLDLEVIEMTRSDGFKIRFFISDKSYKILHVEYTVELTEGAAPVTFRESYSDWRVIQEVLVATKRKLRQNGQLVQTIELENATYGVAHDDVTFLQL